MVSGEELATSLEIFHGECVSSLGLPKTTIDWRRGAQQEDIYSLSPGG